MLQFYASWLWGGMIGTTQQFATAIEARETIAGIILEMNVNDIRSQMSALIISQVAEHYRRRSYLLTTPGRLTRPSKPTRFI
jgi:hypothetical protein